MSELSVPGTNYDRQPHAHHKMTRQATKTNQIPEFFTGLNIIPRNATSHQHQNVSTQFSQNNIQPMVEKTPRNQKSESKKPISRLVEAIAGIAWR